MSEPKYKPMALTVFMKSPEKKKGSALIENEVRVLQDEGGGIYLPVATQYKGRLYEIEHITEDGQVVYVHKQRLGTKAGILN